jgi:F-type H+-transporting ATPase subunit epsilon|mmetsp:Transcript_44477/g.110675  ORF Transcript_44477/g.110675 Transcript_44477/m.110675 type:complete len:134 (+) Transcript_44477:1254-1655(+)
MILNVKIIAPDRTVWETEAEEVILPSSTGQLGILTGHAPLLTALDIGVMRVRTNGKWVPLALMGGFVEVENNKITVLINAAEEGSSIKISEAEASLEKAIDLSNLAVSPKQLLEAKKNLKKARTRVQAATLSI